MPDFDNRSTAPEIMDDLQYAGEMMDRTLRELEIINRWLGGNAVTMNALGQLLKDCNKKEVVTIADLGCGRADMLRLIGLWSARKKIRVQLVGIDANPYIIQSAQKHLANHPEIQLSAVNILSPEFQSRKFDVVVGTLFYHHFTDEELIGFFNRLKDQTRVGFIINDIHRHPLAFYSIRWLTAMFSRSSMVKFDAPLSVLRAFTKKELINILTRAGIQNFTIAWRWAFRWQVIVRTD